MSKYSDKKDFKQCINKEIFIFDLDGTIIKSDEGIINSVIYMLEKRGLNIPERKELYKTIGPPLKHSFSEMFKIPDDEINSAIDVYREHYSEKGIFECSLYDGITEVFERLKSKGKTISLATAKPEEYATKILKYFGLYRYFDVARGSDFVGGLLEKGEIITASINDVFAIKDGLSYSDAIMIGDRKHDILGAAENNIDSVGVLYGYGNRAELEDAGATFIAESVRDLLEILI